MSMLIVVTSLYTLLLVEPKSPEAAEGKHESRGDLIKVSDTSS